MRPIGERRQALGEREGRAQKKKNTFHTSTVPIKLIGEYHVIIEYLSTSVSISMDEAIREARRLIPIKPTVKDRQRKCIADVFKST